MDHEGLVEVDQVVDSLGERDGRRTTVLLFLHRRLWWDNTMMSCPIALHMVQLNPVMPVIC